MPQMSPLMWVSLMVLVLLCILVWVVILYYTVGSSKYITSHSTQGDTKVSLWW